MLLRNKYSAETQKAVSIVASLVKEQGGVPVASNKHPDLMEVIIMLPLPVDALIDPVQYCQLLVTECIDKVGALLSKLEERGECVPLPVWEKYALVRLFEDKVWGRPVKRKFNKGGGVDYE